MVKELRTAGSALGLGGVSRDPTGRGHEGTFWGDEMFCVLTGCVLHKCMHFTEFRKLAQCKSTFNTS